VSASSTSPRLPYSAYQNAKQEHFWLNVEHRLLAMLENEDEDRAVRRRAAKLLLQR